MIYLEKSQKKFIYTETNSNFKQLYIIIKKIYYVFGQILTIIVMKETLFQRISVIWLENKWNKIKNK